MSPTSPFYSLRGGSNAWAQSDDTIDAWRRGAQLDVLPLTLEYAPILACDADCPLCPYKRSRDSLCKGVLPRSAFAAEDDIASSSRPTAQTILQRARDAGVRGVLYTGGGEPLRWALLPEMLAYSSNLGMVNGLYTNGLQLGVVDDLAARLMAPSTGLAFVRVSINTVSPRATRIHWGLDAETIANQWTGLRLLIEARNQLSDLYRSGGKPLPSIQISTLVDKHTINDLPLICEKVAEVMGERSACGSEDVMIVRPLVVHGRKEYSANDHSAAVIQKLMSVCGKHSPGRELLRCAGVAVFLGFGLEPTDAVAAGSYSELINREYASRTVSLANGLFLTVSPDGYVFPATEYNCRPGWELGNLLQQSVGSIWNSQRRREMLQAFNQLRWGPAVLQPTARTNRLDKIAEAIRTGLLGSADIARIRAASYATPPLLLD